MNDNKELLILEEFYFKKKKSPSKVWSEVNAACVLQSNWFHFTF